MPIDDKDYVFARFKSEKPAAANRRETLTIPGRAGATGSRSVEVVRMRSGETIQDRPRRSNAALRGASRDGVFAVRPAAKAALAIEPAAAELAQPPVEAVRLPPPAENSAAMTRGRRLGKPARRGDWLRPPPVA